MDWWTQDLFLFVFGNHLTVCSLFNQTMNRQTTCNSESLFKQWSVMLMCKSVCINYYSFGYFPVVLSLFRILAFGSSNMYALYIAFYRVFTNFRLFVCILLSLCLQSYSPLSLPLLFPHLPTSLCSLSPAPLYSHLSLSLSSSTTQLVLS